MKRLILLIGLLCSVPCFATWTCQQGATGCTNTTVRVCSTSTTSCSITVASTHAGAVEIAAEGVGNGTAVTFTVSGDGTWVTATGSHGTDSTAGGTELAYNLNATGGATTITCTFSAAQASNQCAFYEFTGTGSGFTFDTAATVDDSTTCTSCNGAALTLGTAKNYILAQSSSCGQTCSALSQYTGSSFPNGDGMGYKINVSAAGTLPVWTQSPTGQLAGGAIAIYETVSASANTRPPVIY